jgi:hypothetical protein
MSNWVIYLAHAWPFALLAVLFGLLLLWENSPSDVFLECTFFACFLSSPVLAWHFTSRLPRGWSNEKRGGVAFVLTVVVSLVETTLAMLLFVYGLFYTGLFGE